MSIQLSPGQKIGLSAHTLLADGYSPISVPGVIFSWVSSNPAVATVTFNTKWVNSRSTAYIEALTLGTTTITCTGGAVSNTLIINVVSVPLPTSLQFAQSGVQDPPRPPPTYPRPWW